MGPYRPWLLPRGEEPGVFHPIVRCILESFGQCIVDIRIVELLTVEKRDMSRQRARNLIIGRSDASGSR
jgi:hypothetical protein